MMAISDVYNRFYNFEHARKGSILMANVASKKDQKASSRGGRGNGRGGCGCGRGRGNASSQGHTHEENDEDHGIIYCPHYDAHGDHYPSECYLKKKSTQDKSLSRGSRGSDRGRGRGSYKGHSGFMSNATTLQDDSKASNSLNHVDVDTETLFTNNMNLSCNTAKYDDTTQDDLNQWILDSGISYIMIYARDDLVSFIPYHLPVTTAMGQVFYTEGYGDLKLDVTRPGIPFLPVARAIVVACVIG